LTDYKDLVKRLRDLQEHFRDGDAGEAADAIELLQRELKCSKEMWEQQQELALEYLADIEKANERIAELEAALKDAMEELRHAYIMGFTERYRDAARAALKALGEKE